MNKDFHERHQIPFKSTLNVGQPGGTVAYLIYPISDIERWRTWFKGSARNLL